MKVWKQTCITLHIILTHTLGADLQVAQRVLGSNPELFPAKQRKI